MIVVSYNTCWYVYNFRMPLIRALKARGYGVTVVAPKDEYTERIRAEGISFRDLPLEGKGKNPLRELGSILAFRRVYDDLKPVIALQYTIKPNIYGSIAAATLGIPVVNNVTGLGEAFTTGGLTQFLAKILYRIAFGTASRVFFQNGDDKTLFTIDGLVKAGQVDLLPGSGVDTKRFVPMPRGDGPFTFLQIGRLLKAKGSSEFISAARKVKALHPEVRFALLGRYDPEDSKSLEPSLFEAALAEGIVEYWGETDDVRPLIARADCVVLPSYYREGVPRSLLEAASMGKPLVAANSIGTREPVVEGRNGYLHEARNARDLADKLGAILALDAGSLAAMGSESRKLMQERFEESIVIDKYLEAVELFRLRFRTPHREYLSQRGTGIRLGLVGLGSAWDSN